ncbi:protein disulfide isomerase-like 5-2 isoform X2 [Gossypium arboreum]|uniref:protein disulfide isomerase-like 5-2 isoform X2 n=1 Tax=Gossypium arboreum TaxID=29729 RepID=UPI0008190B23|nr:protein disulfide isomerase-like 5-2 isoform X2 [Gossypium arboreum]
MEKSRKWCFWRKPKIKAALPMPVILLLLLCIFETGISSTADQFKVDGKVLELDEANFDSAISSLDYILVDFYAPWCRHCKLLSPQLDEAAPVLAGLKEPIVIAKVNADKFTRLASKHDVDAYPTLKLFMHGVSMEYYGPREADSLVQYLKKFVSTDVSILISDSAISDFVEEAGTFFPIFIGFGLNETVLSSLAIKYKKRAWFSVAKDFSDEAKVLYDMEKVPALVAIHPNYKQQSIFYGLFEGELLEDFIKQNFLPPVVPLNPETLKLLKDEKRKIVLTITADENEDQTQNLIKLLKAAASTNRDLVFGYFRLKQWEDFADKFGANEKTKLPKIIVWDGDEDYFSVIGIDGLDNEDQGSQLSQFLEGYRQGRTEKKTVKAPLFMGFFNSVVGLAVVKGLIVLTTPRLKAVSMDLGRKKIKSRYSKKRILKMT